ncbi:glycosyltransferase [Jatrophihabitans sp. YIM 134969]
MTSARVRVRVEYAARLDPAGWARRHAAEEVPDALPYGLDRMSAHGLEVDPHTVTLPRAAERVARSVRHRLGGLELVELARTSGRRADVVFAYDERTGVPAALRHRRTPVVTGIGWLTDPDGVPPLQAALVRRALGRAERVFTQCRPVLPLLVDGWGVPEHRARYVPVGIDTDFYARQPWPEPLAATVFTAGEDRYRDHDLLIGAVRDLRGQRPSLRLDLATGLPTSFTSDVGTLHTERLDGRIRPLYAAAAVVAVALHPTVTGSGLTVVLEAMASGRPVVVSDNPGMSDYVDDGRTGLLVPAGDARALASALAALVDDPARARAMGEAAATEVRQRFGTDAMAERLAGLVVEAAGRPEPGHLGSRP